MNPQPFNPGENRPHIQAMLDRSWAKFWRDIQAVLEAEAS